MSKEQIEVVTYEQDRLNYFTDLMQKVQKKYKRLFKKFKDAPYLSEEAQILSDAGREAHFYGDVVEMLEKGYRKQSENVIELPCKVGDAVYQPSYKFTKCSEHDYAPRHYDDSFCLGCESNCDSVEKPYVYKGKVCAIKITKGQIYLVVTFDEKFDSSNFILGETVFLTREEAEAKMKGGAE